MKGAEAMNEKLDARTKWSYCVGATGRDAAYALISMYLILYVQYTMELTSSQFAVLSLIMVLCMIWDAINDPMMGIIIENTHLKFGKYKPWILLGSILNAIVIICLFTIRPQGWAFVGFFGLFYLLWGMTYTMNDIAYWGLLPSLSSDAKTRNMLVTLMSIFICIGQFSVAAIVPMVIAGNAVHAYRVIALAVALCFIGFQVLTAFGVKERKRKDVQEKVTLKKMFRIFFRNDQLVPAGAAYLLYTTGANLMTILGVNFFYVEFGYSEGGNMVFLFTVMYGLGTLVSQALFALISSHFTRKKILSIAMIALTIAYLALMSIGYVLPKNPLVMCVLAFTVFFFQGLFNLVLLVMINNTIEYDEFRFHERHDSIISAVRSFGAKLAGGIDQGLNTIVLLVSGVYAVSRNISSLEVNVEKGSMTSAEVLSTADQYLSEVTSAQSFLLRIGVFLLPLVLIAIAYLILRKKYSLDEKKYAEIVSSLEAGEKA